MEDLWRLLVIVQQAGWMDNSLSFVTYYHCHQRGGGQDGHMDLFGWVEIKDQWTVASHLWFP